jgi:hypothetical protein
LKSDGSVDTSTYLSSSTLYSTIAFTINGNDVEIGDEVSIGSGLSFNDTTYTISSSDTLDSVTGRGATTTNAIVVGSLKSQGDIGVTQADGDFLVRLYQSSADGFIQLYTGEATPVSRVKISSYGDSYINPSASGRLGVGTTAPTAKLHINAANGDGLKITTADVATIKMGSTNGGTSYWGFATTNLAASDFGIYQSNSVGGDPITAGTPRLYFKSDGNVGIGTTSPSKQLEILYPSYIDKDTVQGLIRLTGQSNTENSGDIPSAGVGIEFYNKWSGGAPYSIGRISARGSQSYDGGLQFDVAQNSAPGQSNFTTAMTILDTGNVGIGTTNPTTKLYVDGGETTFNRGNSDGAIARFRGKNAEKAVIGTVDSWFASNVGIGLTSPLAPLAIQANSGAAVMRTVGRSVDNISSLDFYNSAQTVGNYIQSNSSWIRARADGGFHFSNGSTPTTTDTDGFTINGMNVGINTTNPQYKLDVAGTVRFNGNTALITDASSGNYSLIQHNYGGSTKAFSGYNAGFALYGGESGVDTRLQAGGQYALSIKNDTLNVGIGTTSPSYKLDVNGSFNCTSMNVTENISTSTGNVVVQNGAGIYSIKSTIGTSTSGTAFRIANTNDVQAARATFVAETANYQVAKIYEVVKAGTADPVAFKVVDTGPSGEEDFSVSFSNDGGDLLCTVTNDSANESLTLVTTIFVGGSNTSQTVSNS